MAHFPCDSNGVCMVCKVQPVKEENLECRTCHTPWHVACLSSPPATLAETTQWVCPDCSILVSTSTAVPAPTPSGGSRELIAAVLNVESNASLSDQDKARKRQELMTGKVAKIEEEDDNNKNEREENGLLLVSDILNRILQCSICIQLLDNPVTTPCGHTFCLRCFEKWIRQEKPICAKCRQTIPAKIASQPRINSALVYAIRMARSAANNNGGEGSSSGHHFVHNEDKPDESYVTTKAKKKGHANAASGKIFVTVSPHHFGPILPEHDPKRNRGLLVGDCWKYRQECRQWGAHFPSISGIAGQAKLGAQSVVLSGGYIDDEDHGEWFLYTGSGGKDLSGNKRTNHKHSFDQKFERYNEALKVSCLNGYPVRVVRSHKEKRSNYAPQSGLRYDGIYRIEKCWQIEGLQGFKVCRFLFVRCDNQPAPWTNDGRGDRPRPVPIIQELNKATIVIERKGSPSWDFDAKDSCWKWTKSPPPTQNKIARVESKEISKSSRKKKMFETKFIKENMQKGLSCQICKQVMVSPVTTPCAHHFCKSCLEGAFAGQDFLRERSKGGRSLRAQKIVKKCPTCTIDISDFVQNPMVDILLMETIESLKSRVQENEKSVESSEDEDGLQEDSDENCGSEDDDASLENENSIKELNVSIEGSDISELKVTSKMQDTLQTCNAKRKKVGSREQSSKMGDGNVAKKRESCGNAEKGVDEGNDSPSDVPIDHVSE